MLEANRVNGQVPDRERVAIGQVEISLGAGDLAERQGKPWGLEHAGDPPFDGSPLPLNSVEIEGVARFEQGPKEQQSQEVIPVVVREEHTEMERHASG